MADAATPIDLPSEPAVTGLEPVPMPAAQDTSETQLQANLHVAIWDTPPNYICLPCNYKDPDYATLVAHLHTEHNLEPVLTIFARDVLSGQATTFGLAKEFRMDEPTYRTEETQDGTKYLCCWCERAGTGHWSYDKALFVSHLEQRHDGRFIKAESDTLPAADEASTVAQDTPPPSAPPASPDPPPEEGGSVPHAAEESGATEPGA